MGLNIAIIEGRLTRDPEVKVTDQGKSVAKFSVAVDRNYGSRDADYISCIAWEKKAEFVEKYFSKGKGICLTGSIRTGSYTNKDGVKVYTTDLVVDQINFPTSQPKGEGETKGKPDEEQTQIPEGFEAIDESDIPF